MPKLSRTASGGFWSSLLRGPEVTAVALDELRRIGTHMAEADGLLDRLAGDCPHNQPLRQQGVEIGFLIAVRVARVAWSNHPHDRKREIEQPVAFAEGEIDRQPRLPGLCPPFSIVEELGSRRQAVEIVPLRLEQADRVQLLALQVDPVEIVDPMLPQRADVLPEAPVRKLRAIQQHDRSRERIRDLVVTGPRTAPDRLPLQVAGEQLANIANGEDVGI